MRDPARIDRMVEKLRAAWKTNPDLRLGQLLLNLDPSGGDHPFYVEDDAWEAALTSPPLTAVGSEPDFFVEDESDDEVLALWRRLLESRSRTEPRVPGGGVIVKPVVTTRGGGGWIELDKP